MGKKYPGLNATLRSFINEQQMFFVGTAGAEGNVNISPKGMDSLRIVGDNTVRWLNLTGSGNETAAHLLENPRMAIMFCAFAGKPMILRLYGHARAVHPRDPEWAAWLTDFPPLPGARQIFELDINFVLRSCGMSVPCYEFTEQRDQLNQWADKKGVDGIAKYWVETNTLSLDGKPTEI
ncbi:MAG: pyridoxamine 5'-phosphate oxidase family protein [Gammaproteobacteria bacterium]|nr:pyridoxamine 5'-phosphate oxidase family protein [Gammaproteobacteria bacterium]